ncbi:MAG: (2Fe-2S) ferredoxin domain-containing protein [Alphaproteobacteria bacterium]|nr:(2Fe-2S) ferredoxin domain-containing protein [Alphaproteobacteria bacterium]
MERPGDNFGDEPLFYDKHVFVCLNERAPGHPRGCCKEKGAEALRNYMKKKVGDLKLDRVRINQSLCLDRCELGPNMVIYPEGTWYQFNSEADIDEIISTHLAQGKRVKRLMLKVDQKNP